MSQDKEILIAALEEAVPRFNKLREGSTLLTQPGPTSDITDPVRRTVHGMLTHALSSLPLSMVAVAFVDRSDHGGDGGRVAGRLAGGS